MPPLPRKKSVALDLLERASVFVHLDPRRPGVIVPQGFLKQHQLVLQIGLNMAIAIPDLDVTDEGITCTLSFNKRPHFCSLPWGAIYALIGEQGGGMVWPEDVPPEVVSQQQAAAKREVPRQQKTNLRSIGDAADRAGDRKDGVRRASSRPPRLMQVVPPGKSEPKPEPAVARPEPARSEPARSSEPARPEPAAAKTDRPSKEPASKRARPPYLRLVQ